MPAGPFVRGRARPELPTTGWAAGPATVDGRRQRLNVDQTMRGENGESNDVPLGPSIVVMLATSPPGVPANAICAIEPPEAR